MRVLSSLVAWGGRGVVPPKEGWNFVSLGKWAGKEFITSFTQEWWVKRRI